MFWSGLANNKQITGAVFSDPNERMVVALGATGQSQNQDGDVRLRSCSNRGCPGTQDSWPQEPRNSPLLRSVLGGTPEAGVLLDSETLSQLSWEAVREVAGGELEACFNFRSCWFYRSEVL